MMRWGLTVGFLNDINMTVRVVHADGLRSLAKFQIFPRGPSVYVIYIPIYTRSYIRTLSSCAKITTLQHTILEHSQQTPLCVFMSLRASPRCGLLSSGALLNPPQRFAVPQETSFRQTLKGLCVNRRII